LKCGILPIFLFLYKNRSQRAYRGLFNPAAIAVELGAIAAVSGAIAVWLRALAAGSGAIAVGSRALAAGSRAIAAELRAIAVG
jgi:hypothetical protein